MSLLEPTTEELDTVVSYMFLKLGYNTQFIVPYQDGVKLIDCLTKAEKVEHSYTSGVTFVDERIEFEVHNISQRDYRKKKMELLLGLNPPLPKEENHA